MAKNVIQKGSVLYAGGAQSMTQNRVELEAQREEQTEKKEAAMWKKLVLWSKKDQKRKALLRKAYIKEWDYVYADLHKGRVTTPARRYNADA